jgi:hypothetical protein
MISLFLLNLFNDVFKDSYYITSNDTMCRLQTPARDGSSLADFSTLMMEAIRSSETSVHTRSRRRHIPEDDILHSHRR